MKFSTILLSILILTVSITAQIKTEAERVQQAKVAAETYAAKYVNEGIKLHKPGSLIVASQSMTKALAIDPTNRDALINRGIEFREENQYERSRIDLERAVKLYPDDYIVGFQYGVLLNMTGFAAEAFPYFQKATEVKPTDPIYRFYAGGTALRSGRFRECVDNFDAYFAANPADTDANKNYVYLARAECQLQLGNTQAAKTDLSKSSYKLFPDSNWNYLNTVVEAGGIVCKSNADSHYKKAEEFFTKKVEAEKAYKEIFNALKCDPNHLKSLRLQFEIESRAGFMNYEARNHYNRLRVIDPETSPTVLDVFEKKYSNRVELKKDDDSAYASFNSYLNPPLFQAMKWYPNVEIVPGLPLYLKTAAEYIKLARNSFDSLEKNDDRFAYGNILLNLNEALFLDPNNAEALLLRARTFAVFPDEALRPLAWRDAVAALKINPNLALAYNVRGLILRDERHYAEAIAEFNKAISINPREDRAYANIGLIYANQERFDLALPNYEKAVSISPDNTSWLTFRALAYFKTGKFPQAIEDYKKLLTAQGRNLEARLTLIQAYEKTGDAKAASANVYTLLEQYPNESRVKALAIRYPAASATMTADKVSTRIEETRKFQSETDSLVELNNYLLKLIDTAIEEGNTLSKNSEYDDRKSQLRMLNTLVLRKNSIVQNSRLIISKADTFLAMYEKDKDASPEIIQLAKNRITESNDLIKQMNIYDEQWKALRKEIQPRN